MYAEGGRTTLLGGPGDDSFAGAGAGPLVGGKGDDTFHAINGVVDDIRCGLGSDEATVEPSDQVADCERVNLHVTGDAGDNLLYGGPGDDLLDGAEGDDTIVGLSGDDEINLGLGDDLGDGGSGNDRILALEGNDTILGGDGNDFLAAMNGNTQDVTNVTCGSGDDIAFADPSDVVAADCERVYRSFVYGGSGPGSVTGTAQDDYMGGSGYDEVFHGLAVMMRSS